MITATERDLSFQPADNPRPRKLTADQVRQYNERGFITPLPLFGTAEIARHRAYFDSLLARLRALNDGRDQYAINCYQSVCAGIYDLVVETRILDYVEDIVGPNIIGWATHYFCKLPHDPKSVPWHQDASYWQLTPARTVTVWLAIDDADEENAAMQFLPGTHRLGHLRWQKTSQDAVLDQEVERVDDLAARHGAPVYNVLRAGEISLHADMLAHGSPPNRSARRRCGLTIRYCPPEVRTTQEGWNEHAVLCRGVDRTGHWHHNLRPDGDDLSPERAKRRKVIGGN